MTIKILSCAAAAAVLATGVASAAPLYFQGFETNTSGWTVDNGGDNDGAITRTASGNGPLSVPAFAGSYYATVTNDTNDYQPGSGTGGFSNLSGNGVTPTAYPGSGFSQSVSIYIDPTIAAPNTSVPAFWIDMTPDSLTSDGVGCFPAACSDEHNFQLYYDGSSVAVHATASLSPVLTINTAGWYTFQITYQKGATPDNLVQNEQNIFGPSGTLLSSTPAEGSSDDSTLLSDNLAGPGYVWLPAWQNGFSDNELAIDNLRADTVPEPSSLALLACGFLGIAGVGAVRRRKSSARPKS